MIDDSMRAKAKATFGKEFMDQMKVQPLAKNSAVALQQRANARPIPTYKVGGVVKKQAGGAMTRPPAEADDVLASTPRGRRMIEEQRRREAAAERAKAAKRDAADKLLGIPAQKKGGKAGCYADGGKVEDQRVAARMAAGNYKKGGKAKKDGLAVMIAIGSPMKKPSKTGKHEAAESSGMERMERMKPVKRAVGGAGKVRKGMMSPEGKILQAVKPKKGLSGM